MLNLNTRRSTYIANTLAAIVLTLIVNFSYLISMIVDERERDREMYRQERQEERERYRPQFEGTLHLSPDGYGYLIAENGDGFIMPPGWEVHDNYDAERNHDGDTASPRDHHEQHWFNTDSVFVNQAAIFIYNLQDGDQILGTLNRPRGNANPSLDRPLRKNGEDIAPVVYDRPNRNEEFVIQLLFYFCLSLIALTVMTFRFDANNFTVRRYSLRCALTLLFIACCYMFTPVVDWGPRSSEITMIMQLDRDNPLDWMVVSKYLIVLIVAFLYGRIYGMLLKQQQIQIENEHLRTENLQTRYNMLLGQISPHFFFNSLNSLSMLVREKSDEKALAYIDQLSYTFRYIIQNGQNTLSTLEEEIEFARAYGELFKVRYADKLFFDIEIDPELNSWMLPALTLQPLIGNAVKHNTITRKMPLNVKIYTEGTTLIVSNRKAPKIEAEPSTGIGLENLRNRWLLIAGEEFKIVESDEFFTIHLPLQRPKNG
ncbi:MAG: histidine kinase [Alistipes sp.]|nr:histidine kinase [Alistipes sp.]MBO5984083.1 histidine kinase [Rikenellaceae bacterium]MBO7343790.1 histidine kinase [Alistipes sp.]